MATKKYWLDDPRNVTKVYYGVFVVCAVSVLLELLPFLYHDGHKHVEYPAIEGWFGFHGLYGFVGCVFLVLVAKWMRRVVMRKEDYYD